MPQNDKYKAVLADLSEDETKKLAQILATMERIKETQNDRVQAPSQIVEQSKSISETLPPAPSNLLLKVARFDVENKIKSNHNKIQKSKKNIGNIKVKITRKERKIAKIKRKIAKKLNRIERAEKANSILKNLDTNGLLGDIAYSQISSNDRKIENLKREISRRQSKISALENQNTSFRDRVENAENKISSRENTIATLQNKIGKINEYDNLPHGAVVFYLSEKLNQVPDLINIDEQKYNQKQTALQKEGVLPEFPNYPDIVTNQLSGDAQQALLYTMFVNAETNELANIQKIAQEKEKSNVPNTKDEFSEYAQGNAVDKKIDDLLKDIEPVQKAEVKAFLIINNDEIKGQLRKNLGELYDKGIISVAPINDAQKKIFFSESNRNEVEKAIGQIAQTAKKDIGYLTIDKEKIADLEKSGIKFKSQPNTKENSKIDIAFSEKDRSKVLAAVSPQTKTTTATL